MPIALSATGAPSVCAYPRRSPARAAVAASHGDRDRPRPRLEDQVRAFERFLSRLSVVVVDEVGPARLNPNEGDGPARRVRMHALPRAFSPWWVWQAQHEDLSLLHL